MSAPSQHRSPGSGPGSRKPVPPKEGRKTVQVPYPSTSSMANMAAPVTLKKAPWEKGE